MKSRLILFSVVAAGICFSASCTKTYYIDRTVYVEPKPKPKRVDDPDSFDAVTKPTTYSY